MSDIHHIEHPKLHPVVRQGLLLMISLAILLGVLSLYLQPDFLLTLANQVWGCF